MKARNIFLVVLGCILMLASLWVGSYVLGQITFQHWAHFPAAITAFMGFGGGALLAMIGINEYGL